jgi:hypothetical protein
MEAYIVNPEAAWGLANEKAEMCWDDIFLEDRGRYVISRPRVGNGDSLCTKVRVTTGHSCCHRAASRLQLRM